MLPEVAHTGVEAAGSGLIRLTETRADELRPLSGRGAPNDRNQGGDPVTGHVRDLRGAWRWWLVRTRRFALSRRFSPIEACGRTTWIGKRPAIRLREIRKNQAKTPDFLAGSDFFCRFRGSVASIHVDMVEGVWPVLHTSLIKTANVISSLSNLHSSGHISSTNRLSPPDVAPACFTSRAS